MRNLLNLNDPTLLRTDAYIDGRWTATDARFAVIDPATGEDLADVADCDAATTNARNLTQPTRPGEGGRPGEANRQHIIILLINQCAALRPSS